MKGSRKCSVRVALVMLVASCGGGGSGGISGTGIVYGPISGFGSIIVNQTEFDVTQAQISIEGVPAAESDLRLGMLVTVRGLTDRGSGLGTAYSVNADTAIRGPIGAIDVPARELTVLGQLVRIDAKTSFQGVTLETLVIGDVVEVNGLPDSDGAILATRVELEEESEESEIEGRIKSLDSAAETFSIGSLRVDYSSAEIENAPPGGLADGLLVEIESSDVPVDNVLVAREIDVREESVGGEEGEEAPIDGLITAVLSTNRFIVNRGQIVRVKASTQFEGGGASDVAVNVRVEVEGVLDGDSEIIAKKVAFEGD